MSRPVSALALRSWLGIALLCAAAPSRSAVFLVGGDPTTCHYTSVQAAIDAARNHPGPDTVRIARNAVYPPQALKVASQDLVIEGGYPTCQASAPGSPMDRTRLSGAGGAADSVIEISGPGRRILRALLLTGGDDPVSGGGIQFDGSGELVLENVELHSNTSAHGGGINFHGRGGEPALLVLGADVIVRDNLALESGGGVRVTGNAALEMTDAGSAVFRNQAQGRSSDQSGHGGGVLIIGPATARLASPGIDGATLFDNAARHGGGLAVIAPEDDASVTLFSVDASQPFRIAANRAAAHGGGVYLGGSDHSINDAGSDACISAFEIRIDANRAPFGAAIHAQESSTFRLNPSAPSFPCGQQQTPAEAVACAPGVAIACSRISDNRAEDTDGELSDGAIVSAREIRGTHVSLHRVALTGNGGGRLLHNVDCDGCLLVRNALYDSVAAFPYVDAGQPDARLSNSTIADNRIGGAHVLRVGGDLHLRDSIVHQPASLLLLRDGSHARVFGANLLATGCTPGECANFQNLIPPTVGPRFLDAERFDAEGLDAEGLDYRLHAASPAIDASPAIAGDDRDLDGLPRDVEVNPLRATLGVRDLGAYERQTLEPLVPNGDFLVGVSPWKPLGPATAVVVDVGASGAPGGAVLVSDTGSRGANVAALRQCVPLPLPGEYRLTGLAAGQGFLAIHRDQVRIRWRHFASSGSQPCSGTPVHSGEIVFPNSRTLSPPLADALIAVPAATFDERAAIEIELVAMEGNTIAADDSTAGLFDAIRLVPPRL